MMRPFSVMRFVTAIVVAVGLSVAAGSPSAAQDDEENGRTAAQDVRELVLKQRERVLAHVAAIMAGEEEDAEPAEIAEIEEPEDGEGEDGEGEDGEGEDGEGEDGEAEDGEAEDGEAEDGEAEGVGGEGEECEPQGGGVASGEAEGEVAAGDEAEDEVAAGDEAAAEEAEDAEPAGTGADTAGDQEICILPSTGTGSNSEMPSMLSVFAALAAVTAAGVGLRQRFI